MTRQEVWDYIIEQLAVPVNAVSKFLNAFNKVLDFITESSVANVIPEWDDALTFQTDGSDDGEYCRHADSAGNERIWRTKIDDNTNNEPPTDPDITEDTNWIEVSQSGGSAIKEWSAGLYGEGLIIVYHNHSTLGEILAKLDNPSRPYNSTNIETEITAGDWKLFLFPDASHTQAGKVELATGAETRAMTDATRAVTPEGLRALFNSELYPTNNNIFSREHIQAAIGALNVVVHNCVLVNSGPVSSTYLVEARVAIHANNGNTSGGTVIAGVFRKGSGGGITQVGATQTPIAQQEDLSGTVTVSFQVVGGSNETLQVSVATPSVGCNSICHFKVTCITNQASA